MKIVYFVGGFAISSVQYWGYYLYKVLLLVA